MKYIFLFFLSVINMVSKAQLYLHDFGTTAISAHPYNISPAIFDSHLANSSWTNSLSTWTSFAGSSGEAIALSNSGGSPTVTLTFAVSAGYKLNVSSFNFWRQRSATGAQNWSMTINGIAVGSGTIPTTGAAIGPTTVLNPANDLGGTVTIIISLTGASGSGTFRLDDFTLNGTVIPNAYTMLDNFNRNDTIRPAIPSSGGSAWWVEQEPGLCLSGGSALDKIRIKNNQLELSSCTYANASCLVDPVEATSMIMTGKYPTVFSTAASTLEWYFNMQQTRADPSGFASGQYGAAFVIGSNTNDPAAASKQGYAVIFGESGTVDPIRLVSFNGSNFNSGSFTNILSVASPATKTDYMSIKVSYNPCTGEWTLTVRDDGASFADPSTVTGIGASAVNTTFTSTDLYWLGVVWSHSSTCAQVRFDNIYIPNAVAATGTYVWTGASSNDFQSPYNWTPRRQCVKPTDKLVFNSSSPASSVLTNVPDQTIAQLTVSNNRTVTISDVPGDGLVSTLSIAGATGTDLQIDAGSSLVFDVTTNTVGDAVVIDLAAGATGTIAGILSFNSTPGGTRSHRLTAADAMAINVNSGGVIRAMNLLGNPFGSSGSQNTVVFNTGSAYECYSGANPFGLAQPNSKVIFNAGSVYRHYTTNQPSVLGRVYANVEFYESVNINSGGAAALTVNNLKVLNGTLQFTGTLNSLPVNTNIKGDLVLLPGTTFNYDPVAASTCIFNGAGAAQKINSAGTLVLGRLLTVRLNSSFATPPQLTVETNISVAGVLDIAQGTLQLSGNITLLSDSASTASTAPITGAVSYGAGRFIVERYIPRHSKAWQFLAVPTTGQTVNASWQEGNGAMQNNKPGYGTIITSNIAGTGFDLIGGGGPSMKTYDTTGAGSWKGISRTDTAIYNKKGYMLFVRGDRSVTTTADTAKATILRSTGKIFDAISNIPPVSSVGAGKFESIGNPYTSAVDFSNDAAVIKSANIQRVFYVWDPKLGGGQGFGAYQTFIKGAGTDYTVLPGGGSYGIGGSVSNFIQSGQAFFVHAVGGIGTVSFNENAKAAGSSLVTRIGNSGSGNVKQLRTNLYLRPGNDRELLDAVLTECSSSYPNNIDVLDALKIDNTGETIGIASHAELLSVERRGNLSFTDSIVYNIERLKQQQYEFEFIPVQFAVAGLTAFLEDRYMHSLTPLNLNNSSTILFTVNTDPASAAPNRFRIIFRQNNIVHAGTLNKISSTAQLSIFPNPVESNNLTLTFSNYMPGKYRLQLLNQSSQVVMQQELLVPARNFKTLIKLPGLIAGTYQLFVNSSSGAISSSQLIIVK